MSVWYAICDLLPLEFLSLTFMKNALLAVLVMAPLFGIFSTMVSSPTPWGIPALQALPSVSSADQVSPWAMPWF